MIDMSNETLTVQYPQIEPLPQGTERPLWSVMIPAYNRVATLADTLRSVLAQAPGRERMQIEVVDNCSDKVDMQAFVRSIAGDRVDFFQQAENVGMIENWTSCIRRARGEWVQILHDDDTLQSGFYAALEAAALADPQVGLAFCRTNWMRSDGRIDKPGRLLQSQAGVLRDAPALLAIRNDILPPTVVVRREVYEAVGGFLKQWPFTVDWEMWRRIAARYPIWYEPRPLANYRLHENSGSTPFQRSARDIADVRKCTAFCRRYLPESSARSLSRKCLWRHSLRAILVSGRALCKGDCVMAWNQFVEGCKCVCGVSV